MRTLTLLCAISLMLSAPYAAAQGCTYTQMTCGSRATGRIEQSACRFSDTFDPYAGYFFHGFAGEVVDIYAFTNSWQPQILLYRGQEETPVKYDTFPGTTSSHIRFDIGFTDDYYIVIAPYGGGSPTGTYEVDLFCDTVCKAPFIVLPPPFTQNVHGGDVAALTVQADGTPPLHYTWHTVANPQTAFSTDSATFTTPALFQTTQFQVRVTNSCGSVESPVATVNVLDCLKPTIVQQPANVGVPYGGSAEINVVVDGAQGRTFQWYGGVRGDTSVLVSTDATLRLTNVTAPASYWVRVTNGCGTIDSSAALVSIVATRRRASGH